MKDCNDDIEGKKNAIQGLNVSQARPTPHLYIKKTPYGICPSQVHQSRGTEQRNGHTAERRLQVTFPRGVEILSLKGDEAGRDELRADWAERGPQVSSHWKRRALRQSPPLRHPSMGKTRKKRRTA
ncbi:hypothetical protein JRQ81_010541 [Phrynocephalus forsythii]|uniref:Uncharacterized protein n=1 Tax=Phrynocephalus forsythii TaxID=171643 RepID=A0A9Q1B5F5_9SAUR|nr:hypothetical protein JRQ81_010541 [Phrynocephalus forsythii]